MENPFVRTVNEISNLSNAATNKEFDSNLRGKWNNYLNEMTSLDFNVMTTADANVSWNFWPPYVKTMIFSSGVML